MTEPIIETGRLTRRFGELAAVDRLDLTVKRGEIFGLVGPDGAGKTTTLRLLAGLLDPSEGWARVEGIPISGDTQRIKDRIGYMAQRFGLYPDLTVDENIRFYAALFGASAPGRKGDGFIENLLRITRLFPFRSRQAGKLSGGMKQKLALICTLLHRPRLLLLDEPTTGVDPVSRRDFWSILHTLLEDEITILITTSYLDEAERCGRVGLMYEGRLIRCNSPQELISHLHADCYAVTNTDLRRAGRLLERMEGVTSAAVTGSRLHVLVVPGLPLERLKSDLGSHGLTAEFTRVRPTLEDVFIALVRKESRGGA